MHDLSSLRACFSGRLLQNANETQPFLTDWRGRWHGQAIAVAQPDTTADVAAIVRWCASHQVPVVTQGGNTGLSGGSVPDQSRTALLLSLTRLNRVRQVDVQNNTLTVEAGCTLQQVQEIALAHERLFPLSLAAQGSCTIGGNLATNAGGVQVLRYGNARELCLGLEVVTPNGEIWNGLRALRKDNTGYDLRDLYIGSEGTLGVITAAVLKLFPLPATRQVALVALQSPADAVQLLQFAQRTLASSLSAFEIFSETCLTLVLKHMPETRRPFTTATPWYVLIEVSAHAGQAGAQLETLLEQALEQALIEDAAVSASMAQFAALWALRENISEAQAQEGKNIKHDIALPISEIADFIQHTGAVLAQAYPTLRLVVFGHVGDGNLHYNISPSGTATPDDSANFAALEPAINRLVHDAVQRHHGSISAEHGLGVLRREEAQRYKSPIEIALMHAVKRALDPHNLMNPGKVL
jgi:FAD/FMN-containing dehydrogenase